MTTPSRPVTRVPHLLHGGDYNPEQWPPEIYPHVWDEDVRLMKLAGVNVVSVGIFSWAMLEPQEGRFEFDWFDRVMDKLAAAGVSVNLATPSGAKPNWMAARYPEIRRCNPQGVRDPQQGRHNHCYTSPVYRDKVTIINTKLAEHFRGHPALVMWHVSNEYSGECHCNLCKEAFRAWLRDRYGSLDELNHAWWSTFWSHRYSDWSQIDAIDPSVHGLTLDWKRFVTHQTVDFFKHEIAPLKRIAPGVPVTTNTMGTYAGLDYWRFVPHVDVMAWDAYPNWHGEWELWKSACYQGFVGDMYRAFMPDRPWILMESTPSQTNWQAVSPLKRPGLHELASLQTVAHGSDGVMYFQWRKSRGSSEKFHGAVVDHLGTEHHRVFREVAALGRTLAGLDDLVGLTTPVEVGLILDWENRWAIDVEQGPQNRHKQYEDTVVWDFYAPLWKLNISMEVIESLCDFSKYKLLIAPMLYMLKPGVAQRLTRFVDGGGTLITTYFTGLVNDTDLCWLGGWPGDGLRTLLGLWVEEIDALPEPRRQKVTAAGDNAFGLQGEYEARHYVDLVHAEGAQTLATFAGDFYTGRPAVTRHRVGQGQAIHIASRHDERFQADLLRGVATSLGLRRNVPTDTPPGVSVQRRGSGPDEHLFVMNFNTQPHRIDLGGPHLNAVTGDKVAADVTLPPLAALILRRA